MADGMLSNALHEFELALDDLSSNSEFIKAAGRLRPRLSDMLRWESLDSDAKTLVDLFLKQRTVDESLFYRGMIVSLAGAFEHFVRRVLRDSILGVNKVGFVYDDLDSSLANQNLYRTGVALQTVREPVDYLELDYDSLARNLGTCVQDSTSPVLNAEAFAIFVSIVSPDKLVEALKRINVELDWDDFGKLSSIQGVLAQKDTRQTAKALQDYLKRFGKTRNKIAHSGSGGIVVTESDFTQLLVFFRKFAFAIASITEARLTKM